MSKLEKDIFINSSVKSIEIDGSTTIPTILYYKKYNDIKIGSKAILHSHNRLEINEDFKVDIGNIDAKTSHKYKNIQIATGEQVSALKLTSDFFRELFKQIIEWLHKNNYSSTPNLLIAEPLSLHQGEIVKDKWLKKYRENIRNIMSGSSYGLNNISFLPEPFAVFQYYRYGYKHPILSEQIKNNALVVDFGGGTFDVCIIETTKTGDIKIGGKHSRPIAASSVPRGGYFINRIIAENILKKVCNQKISKGIKLYSEWRRESIDIEDLNAKNRIFIRNFHNLIYAIETVKINLCNQIQYWDIENIPTVSTPAQIPQDPFSEDDKQVNVTFSAKELFEIFHKQIWIPYLKNNIKCALQRGKEELKRDTITVVLLSGGSANIGWLKELIIKDFSIELGGIEIFSLPNFQEVVSQGLAIECARQFFTIDKQGDFSAVTYNALCLALDPDETGVVPKPFKSKVEYLPDVKNMPGVLIPAASEIKKYIDKPLKWRVKLNRRPSKRLDYYFLRSTTEFTETDNRMNIVDKTVFTPPKCKFDKSIQLNLTVKENGTAIPEFIYKTDRDGLVITSVKGQPFPIDVTCEQQGEAEAYIGLDFGTSNTSVSFVDNKSIQFYKKKTQDTKWKKLIALVDILPFPLAITLSGYVSQTDLKNRIIKAREFIEMAFSLISYVTYLDYCSSKGSQKSKIFKGFTKRSAGPLWKLLKESLRKTKKDSICSKYLKILVNDDNFKIIDETINNIAQHKHEKIDDSKIEVSQAIQIIANIANQLFSQYYFGFIDQIKRKKFKKDQHEGIFRVAHGKPPFVNVLKYTGSETFDSTEAILINCKNGKIFPLSPLIFWDECSNHQDLDHPGHCFFYDIKQKNSFSYKAAGYTCTCNVTDDNEYEEIAKSLQSIIEEDPKINLPNNASFDNYNVY